MGVAHTFFIFCVLSAEVLWLVTTTRTGSTGLCSSRRLAKISESTASAKGFCIEDDLFATVLHEEGC
jgi:hypothetical protein